MAPGSSFLWASDHCGLADSPGGAWPLPLLDAAGDLHGVKPGWRGGAAVQGENGPSVDGSLSPEGENEAHMFLSTGAISCLGSVPAEQVSPTKEKVGSTSGAGWGSGPFRGSSQEWLGSAGFVFGSATSPGGLWPTTPGLRLEAKPEEADPMAPAGLASPPPATAAE